MLDPPKNVRFDALASNVLPATQSSDSLLSVMGSTVSPRRRSAVMPEDS